MNGDRARVWLAFCVALSLLLPGCAAVKSERKAQGWTYSNTQLKVFWWYQLVEVSKAHTKATGVNKIIAIVDTGVVTSSDNFAKPPLVGAATCGTDSGNTTDKKGHGTQLAGVALGKDPGKLTQGVAPDAALVPIKVDCGVVTPDSLLKGLDEAIKKTPDIILLALGSYPTAKADSDELARRVRDNANILFVVASVWDNSPGFPFPTWTRFDNVIVVAAMTLAGEDGEVPYNSRRGDIWAPGRDVETVDFDFSQYFMQGTSAASAIVAGCAALVKEKTNAGGKALRDLLITAAETKPYLAPSKRLNCNTAIP